MRYRQLKSTSGLVLAALLAAAVVVMVDATFRTLKLDLTENNLYTLSQGTRNILRSLEEPVTLDFYFSRSSLSGYPSLVNYGKRVRDLLAEYQAVAGDNIKLRVIEPEPFSEAEDRAVASGLRGFPVNAGGDYAYLGLVGANTLDDEVIIPFFNSERASSLEYDISKLIYNLAHPDKRTIGVISSLPMFGDYMNGRTPPWTIAGALREFFDVRDLGGSPDQIDESIDVLMIVHPNGLSTVSQYAIDQFLLRGGHALIFADPMAEADQSRSDPNSPMQMPNLASRFEPFLSHWGIEIPEGVVIGDLAAAIRVQSPGARGPQVVEYLPWLGLDAEHMNQDDFVTRELNTVNLATAGAITQKADSPLTLSPLIQSSTLAGKLDQATILFQRDPSALRNNFQPDGEQYSLAVRLSGKVSSIFPDGKPEALTKDQADDASPADGSQKHLTEGEVNIILVADADMLTDPLWVRRQSFLGMQMPQPFADNANLVINALDNLTGNTDLISLRSRGEYARPFQRVEVIQREAENRFREQEQQLQARLRETENKLAALQQETNEGGLILTPEQTREIEKFRQEQVKTRKELRAVQHELKKNIERLGTQLKFINIGLIPLLIIVLSVGIGLYRVRARA